jgi:hypothetical protein
VWHLIISQSLAQSIREHAHASIGENHRICSKYIAITSTS